MTPRIARLTIVLLATAPLVVAACGRSSPPKAATAQQLAQHIADKGAGCRDFTANDTAAQSGSADASSGACTVGGERVALAVYQSANARDKGQVELLKGCIGRRALNPTSTSSYSFAKGPTWVVLSPDSKAVTSVGRALHISVQKSPC